MYVCMYVCINKRKALFMWLTKQKADIVFLQETYSSIEDEKILEYAVERQNVIFTRLTPQQGHHGINKTRPRFLTESVLCDPNGRFIILEAVVQDTPVLLVNIYAPNKTHEPNDRLPNDKKCQLLSAVQKKRSTTYVLQTTDHPSYLCFVANHFVLQ